MASVHCFWDGIQKCQVLWEVDPLAFLSLNRIRPDFPMKQCACASILKDDTQAHARYPDQRHEGVKE
jgi:hypothetical protein